MKAPSQPSASVPVAREAGNASRGKADTRRLVNVICNAAHTKMAGDIRILDLAGLTDVADVFVICSGESAPQLRAIRDEIQKQAKEIKERPWHVEEAPDPKWILMDYVNVVVHIFEPSTRKFYNLERLWSDAKVAFYPRAGEA